METKMETIKLRMRIVRLRKELEQVKKEFDQYRKESIKWSVEDFIWRASDRGKIITEEQASEALENMIRHHDAEYGIGWPTIDYYIDEYAEVREAV